MDTPTWIRKLFSGNFNDDHWNFLWDELHHQGDVGEASYAVVPYLAQYALISESNAWHLWAFPVVVEFARLDGENPEIPQAIKSSYFQAFKVLAKVASEKEIWEDLPAPCLASCIALAKGQPIFARAYLEMSGKQTALDFLKEETGWEP
jgi:hypothetical protein